MLQIALSGSRHLRPGAPAFVAAARLLAALPAGSTPATGCCPTGLDLFVRTWCAACGVPLRIFQAASRSSAALRARTIQLVQSSAMVLSFPRNPCPISSGSWLSVWSAVRAGVPVLVHLPGFPLSSFPCLCGVSGWQAAALPFCPGVALAAPVIQQSSIFTK